jgi:predicted O-methyltransferase YrrM
MSAAFTTVGMVCFAFLAAAPAAPAAEDRVQPVIDEVEQICARDTIYMLGPEKAKRLAELVREAKPKVVVECGTAIGYSGLWIARELRAAAKDGHQGKLITIEIDPERARRAEAFFKKAGVDDLITVKVGDAAKVVKTLEGPIDFAFIDCNGPNYFGCLEGLKDKLTPGAILVADNAGISASSMKDYLEFVRKNYQSRTEWFELNLPWAKRDALEISVVPNDKK